MYIVIKEVRDPGSEHLREYEVIGSFELLKSVKKYVELCNVEYALAKREFDRKQDRPCDDVTFVFRRLRFGLPKPKDACIAEPEDSRTADLRKKLTDFMRWWEDDSHDAETRRARFDAIRSEFWTYLGGDRVDETLALFYQEARARCDVEFGAAEDIAFSAFDNQEPQDSQDS